MVGGGGEKVFLGQGSMRLWRAGRLRGRNGPRGQSGLRRLGPDQAVSQQRYGERIGALWCQPAGRARVITAVILGGASLNGGKGSIPGALAGVAFMGSADPLIGADMRADLGSRLDSGAASRNRPA